MISKIDLLAKELPVPSPKFNQIFANIRKAASEGKSWTSVYFGGVDEQKVRIDILKNGSKGYNVEELEILSKCEQGYLKKLGFKLRFCKYWSECLDCTTDGYPGDCDGCSRGSEDPAHFDVYWDG